MGYVLQCSVALPPGSSFADCPLADQLWVTLDNAIDWNALGFTPEAFSDAFGWGFGVVAVSWGLGYVVAVALKAIQKL